MELRTDQFWAKRSRCDWIPAGAVFHFALSSRDQRVSVRIRALRTRGRSPLRSLGGKADVESVRRVALSAMDLRDAYDASLEDDA